VTLSDPSLIPTFNPVGGGSEVDATNRKNRLWASRGIDAENWLDELLATAHCELLYHGARKLNESAAWSQNPGAFHDSTMFVLED
jgi:hypothetical protein